MTKTKFTPKELIGQREELISNIKKNWDRIKLFNGVEKGFERPYDVKAVYKTIIDDSLKLIKIKVAIQAINMGLKSMSELPKENVYSQIFLLSQLKEQKVKLKLVPLKGEDIIFTRKAIESEVNKIDLEISKIESELESFNSNTVFEL
jgi:hypothetical protein